MKAAKSPEAGQETPKISVVIPTYGRDKVLLDTVRDVLKQDFDFELLVVDQTPKHDAETQHFLDELTDPRVRYFLVGPPSLPAARNFALAKAKSNIVLYIDDDVILEPDFIKYHYMAFQRDSQIVAVAGRVINQTNTQRETKTPLSFDRYGMGSSTFNCTVSQYGSSFPGGNVSVRRAATVAAGGFDPSHQGSAVREESDAAWRLTRAGGKIYYEARASLLHLAAPSGGSRIPVYHFDSLDFYQNDLLFMLKTVKPWDWPIALVKRYRDAVFDPQGTTLAAKLRRSWLFVAGLWMAGRYRIAPLRIVQRPLAGGDRPYRIAIDGRPFAGSPNGYTTYLSSIIEPLATAGWEITLLTSQPLRPAFDAVSRCQVVNIGGNYGSWRWEQSAVPKILRTYGFDLYFAGSNRAMPWGRSHQTRHILGLLDVIPFRFPRLYILRKPWHFLRHDLAAELLSIWRADAIITISQQSAHDIKRYFRRPAKPFLIKLDTEEPVVAAGDKQRQFVYVGGVDPRKRIDNLLRAFARFRIDHPDYRLILIGRGYEMFDDLIRQLGIEKDVELIGVLDDADKVEAIATSQALVYPSLYEGYGLAIAEAILADTAVIAGVGGAQREVGGNAALYIDPEASADIAAAMARVIEPATQTKLQQARRQQRRVLTSPHISDDIVDYFRHQAEKARGTRS